MRRFVGIKIKMIALALLWVIGIGCRDRLADGGTETTNGTVTGIAAYSNGYAAADARVRLRPMRYLPGMYLGPEDSISHRWEAKSDAQGKFHFTGVDQGQYSLEINDGKAYATLTNFEMNSTREKVELSKSILTRTSTLSGTLRSIGQLSGSVAYIRVFGMERLAFADRQGNFVIQDMPAGNYSLRINVASPYFDSVTLAENIVVSDSDTHIGQIKLPLQGCATYACDSLAVRAILDANDKTGINVTSVTTRDLSSSRITTLKFTNMGLNVLPEEVGSLTALKTLRLQGNKFDTLPHSIVNLPVLEILDLENNLLQFLPNRLGEITSLITLKLNTNNLEYLPEGLGRLQNLTLLTVARTKLRALPEDITNCKSLVKLELTSDSLTSLPVNMGNLISLKKLLLDSNQLSNFPISIMKLNNFDTLFLDGNRFCKPLSAELESWVKAASNDGVEWNNRQKCP